ncbi:Phage integrase, N-terminal SAM-like domain [Candidatus Fervidibacteria bacterium JGI MDM2 SSWTFF-3-K9]
MMTVPIQSPLSWEKAINTFLHLKRLSGFSPATLEWYEVTFKLFDRFHKTHKLFCPSPSTCPPEHIQTFLWWLSRKDRPITVHTKFRALRAFFRWLVKEGFRQDNPIAKVTPPKVNEPLPKTVTEEHFVKTLSALNLSRFAHLRDAALFALAFDSGARLSELVNLRLGDIDLTLRCAKVKGKGNKERMIYFGTTTCQLLSRYLAACFLRFGPLSQDSFLFLTNDGRSISKRQVEDRWKKAQKRVGLKPLPFHGLRHGFARIWLLRGGDAFSLQLLLGHTSPEVTKRYVTLWGSDLQRLHRERSPVDALAPALKLPRQRLR